jgi:hypothetical protein
MARPAAAAKLDGERRYEMTTTSHDVLAANDQARWYLVPELWISLAIAVMWAAVTVTAIFGPDITSMTVRGDHVHGSVRGRCSPLRHDRDLGCGPLRLAPQGRRELAESGQEEIYWWPRPTPSR